MYVFVRFSVPSSQLLIQHFAFNLKKWGGLPFEMKNEWWHQQEKADPHLSFHLFSFILYFRPRLAGTEHD